MTTKEIQEREFIKIGNREFTRDFFFYSDMDVIKGMIQTELDTLISSTIKADREGLLKSLPEERIIHGYMNIQDDEKSTEYCNGWNDYRISIINLIQTNGNESIKNNDNHKESEV